MIFPAPRSRNVLSVTGIRRQATRVILAQQHVSEQRDLIEEHGDNEAGYIDWYHGMNGLTAEQAVLIYRSDVEALGHYKALVSLAMVRRP